MRRKQKKNRTTAAAATVLNSRRDHQKAARPAHIVGMGGSAGAFEAIEEFFTHMPPASGLAFVIVTLMDPTRKGMMPVCSARRKRSADSRICSRPSTTNGSSTNATIRRERSRLSTYLAPCCRWRAEHTRGTPSLRLSWVPRWPRRHDRQARRLPDAVPHGNQDLREFAREAPGSRAAFDL